MQNLLSYCFAAMQSVRVQEKLRNGGTARLSLAQMVNSLVKLADARKNLTEERYHDVCHLFSAYQERKEKVTYDWKRYEMVAMSIIKKFDALAPYETYCGRNEVVWHAVMEHVRKEAARSMSV